jgi:hypothetical protein
MRKLTIILIAAAIALSLRGRALVQAAGAPPAVPANAAPAPAGLRVEFTWRRQEGDRVLRTTAHGLATAVGAHTLLTHNHYPRELGTLTNQILTLTDASGRAIEVAPAEARLQAIDEGTLLIELPRRIELEPEPVGEESDVQAVAPGDCLTVQYWDDEQGRLAQAEFEVVAVGAGVATLADPRLLINGGDSGGGVYREGRLVGNTWSVNTNADCQRLGLFNVALLPGAVTGGGYGSMWHGRGAPSPVAVIVHIAPAAQ